jgi:hypothetical protein
MNWARPEAQKQRDPIHNLLDRWGSVDVREAEAELTGDEQVSICPCAVPDTRFPT